MSISNILIIISTIVTIIAYFVPSFYQFWLNSYFFDLWFYHIFLIQFLFYQLLHWWIFHLAFNSIFIYVFWNQLEVLIWKTKFLYFFIFNTFFTWIMLFLFNSWNTIWISWFCLALLTYVTLELYNRWNPEYKWWITAIIINIAIWFTPWISLAWHLFWSIAWVLFYFGSKLLLKKKLF